ncbi:hypothetical protein SI65_06320 [Aspergillus cristatus]|uniref:Histone-lysine N-methyltransferase ash1 n=1 Tax=Aspergillus cristatus TaxID=573508 RepID=A0A1E3BBZ0_ASPCR|nr:hypothetical protein SI65_06320 [Aspergillus cristatus]
MKETQVASAATSTLLTDLPQTIEIHEHTHIDEITGLETPEQLLTPENSRSETSSNNENASSNDEKEKPVARRRSTRVTRASLQAAQLETPETGSNDASSATNGDTPVNAGLGGKRASSRLRHSIAVMEWSEASETSESQSHANMDKHPLTPDTSVSETSQEPASEEVDTSIQPRTLRKRADKTKEDTVEDKEERTAESKDNDEEQTLRRSSRRGVAERVASRLAEQANTVLGKRTRGAKAKEPDRRSSLRPRSIASLKEEPAPSTNNDPSAKKRRVSDSDLPSSTKSQQEEESTQKEEEEEADSAPVLRRSKRWLAHGLYSGQEPEGTRPTQTKKNKTTFRRRQRDAPRKYLPMPMFAGDRLLQNGRDFQLPFDIFSPLPPGQPKPNEWRKTNKNVFVGEAGSIWRANKDMELSKCMCTADTGCDENCQNRYMFYECDNGNCSLGRDCGNRSFDELKQRTKAGGKYNIGVEVIKTSDRGYGVRSNRTFEANQIIVEYTGEIITQSECEKRMRTTYKKNECYYLMYFDQNMIIDATRGSIARFVNHSCEPNCRMEKWTVAGKPRMALFAGDRGIMTGEELTYDYNFDPYSQKNVQQCRCGSANCRGVLGPRPREKEQRSKEREEQKKQNASAKKTQTKTTTKRKIGSVIDESASRLKKKRKTSKTGVKKAVSRSRASVSRSTTTKKTEPATKRTTKRTTKATTKSKAATATATPTKTAPRTNRNVKLPNVTTKAKVKTTVRTTTKAKPAAKAQPSKTKAASTLKRPSAETKAKILAAAKGTGRKRGPYKKTDAKEEVKPKAGHGRWGGARTKTAKAAKGAAPKKTGRGVKAGKK